MVTTLDPVTVEPRTPVPREEVAVPLVVRFTNLGRETTSIQEWSISSGFMTATDGFDFTYYDEQTENLRGLELQPVELVLDGASQLIGRIDTTTRGDNGFAVKCHGRDFIADLVECNVDPGIKVKSGENLFAAIAQAASVVGIDAIFSDVDDDFTMATVRSGKKAAAGGGHTKHKRRSKKKGAKLDEFKPSPGQGIYDFLNKIVAREGATIQPGPNRNTLVIAEPNYDQAPLYSLQRSLDPGASAHNNIITGEATRDFSSFPTYTLMNGTQARGGEKSAAAHTEVDMFAVAAEFQSELRDILMNATVSLRWKPGQMATEVRAGTLYRLLNHRDEVARNAEQVERACKRAIAERLKDTLKYAVTVKGHIDQRTGAIFAIDTLVRVDDDHADVHEVLWISERTLRYSESDGPSTDLICWRPESFSLSNTYEEAKPAAKGKSKAQRDKELHDAHEAGRDRTAPLIDLTPVEQEADDKARYDKRMREIQDEDEALGPARGSLPALGT